jgi:hypothetical protein
MNHVHFGKDLAKTLSLKIGRTIALGAFSLYLIPMAQAQTVTAPTAGNPVFQQCAQTSGVTLPAMGSGQRLDRADHAKIRQCMNAERKQAFIQCAQANGVTPPQSGTAATKPTPAEFKLIRQCMNEKGFKRWHARHNHRRSHLDGQVPAATANS